MNKKKIFLVDDESDFVKLVKLNLEANNYEVITAFDGKEAIDKMKEVKPDLAILDIRMPKLNGLEVAGEIRKFDKNVKIVFITAFQSPELSKEAAKHDIINYIVKPVAAKDILKVIKQSLA